MTEADVLEAMPTDMIAMYETWVTDNPDKEGRLGDLTLESVATCRTAVQSGSPAAMDSDETHVPATGYRHMINTTIFNLGVEMNFQFAQDFYSLVTRADIWLRAVQIGSISIPPADGVMPAPSYEPPEHPGRMLDG